MFKCQDLHSRDKSKSNGQKNLDGSEMKEKHISFNNMHSKPIAVVLLV